MAATNDERMASEMQEGRDDHSSEGKMNREEGEGEEERVEDREHYLDEGGLDMSLYRVRKCKPSHPARRFNEFYVTRKTNRLVLIKRAVELMARPKVTEIVLIAMGAVVEDCCNLANALVWGLNRPECVAEALAFLRGTRKQVPPAASSHGDDGDAVRPEFSQQGRNELGARGPAGEVDEDGPSLRRVALAAKTSSVQLLDELEPIDGTVLEPLVRVRYNSAVHLRIYKL